MGLKVSVFGTGYVGLVTGVCFAEKGHFVIGADIDQYKIENLKRSISPIYEPGLEELLAKNLKNKSIEFTNDMKYAVENSDLLMIAVGTPPNEDGSADLKYVLAVAETIATFMNGDKFIITKSTVPVGTYLKVKEKVRSILAERGVHYEFDVISNPEFLREGCAIEDCLEPSRAIVGAESEKAAKIMQALYEPFLNGRPFHIMDPVSSEMTKYASNSMLAAKISLMNEFARLCEKVGANIESVREGMASDPRIGPHFISAGIGYGGSCFPKDVKALIHTGDKFSESMNILKAVEEANYLQRTRFYDKLKNHFGGELKGRRIAIWGVAFKPGTDDIREAPAIDLIEQLLTDGAFLSVYDPIAERNTQMHFGEDIHLEFEHDPYEALQDAEALCIFTEWLAFREPDFKLLKAKMNKAVIFDGRNLYSPYFMKKLNIQYTSVGRPQVTALPEVKEEQTLVGATTL